MTTTDLTLTCRECGREFSFSDGDHKKAVASGSPGRPSRCPECRAGQARTYETPVFEDRAPRLSRVRDRRVRGTASGAAPAANAVASAPVAESSETREETAPASAPRRGARGYQVTCAACGTDTTIRFQPRSDRPVYCDPCYAERKNGSTQAPPQQARAPRIAPQVQASEEAPADIPRAEDVFPTLDLESATRAAVAAMGISTPTPIQQGTIPVLQAGRDVVGQARTGSGKTLSFAIPMVEHTDSSLREVQGLVLVPTRELAIQVERVMRLLAVPRGIAVTLLYGGRSLRPEEEQLRRRVHIVVGTPGRTLDHIRQGNLSLGSVRVAVLDEADEMLDRGFAPDVERILSHTPPGRQTALFSATMPDWVQRTASSHLRNPEMVEVDAGLQAPPEIDHLIYDIDAREKLDALRILLDQRGDGAVLVFGRTKHGVRKLAGILIQKGYDVDALQGNMNQIARERVIDRFRSGKLPILVATNVAARGLDIEGIDQVINYDLPDSELLFTHRVGRTGRMGRSGEAVTFVTPDEASKWREIWRASGGTLRTQPWPNAKLPVIPSSVSDDLPKARRGSSDKKSWHFAPPGSRGRRW